MDLLYIKMYHYSQAIQQSDIIPIYNNMTSYLYIVTVLTNSCPMGSTTTSGCVAVTSYLYYNNTT